MSEAVPVIVCDVCRAVTLARLNATKDQPAVTEQQRIEDLRAEGWTLTPTRDTCPFCSRI